MTISEHGEHFFGKQIHDYASDQPVSNDPGIVYRLALDYDSERTMAELLEEFLGRVDKASLQALVIGAWQEPHDDSPAEALDVLVRHAAELPQLKALFVGDMTYEQCEISWIIQGDYGPLLEAFPRLEALQVRGSTSLVMPAVTHQGLRRLVIECGGLPASVLETLAASFFPALEHLELWLGTEEYGFDGDLAAVERAVQNLRTPTLRYLGLRDAEIADEVAQWLAGEAWVASLAELDLSLGTLGDEGARALLDSPHVRQLQRLDLSHHYVTQPLQAELAKALPGVVLDDPQEEDDECRYVAVGE